MPLKFVKARENLSNLGTMIGLRSLNRDLKAEDCYNAAVLAAHHETMTGKPTTCPVPEDDEMMVAGDLTVNNQRAATFPDWAKTALALLAAMLTAIFLLLMLLAILAAIIYVWPVPDPPAPPTGPTVRFIKPS